MNMGQVTVRSTVWSDSDRDKKRTFQRSHCMDYSLPFLDVFRIKPFHWNPSQMLEEYSILIKTIQGMYYSVVCTSSEIVTPEQHTGWNWDCITGEKIFHRIRHRKKLFILLKREITPNKTFIVTPQSYLPIYILQGDYFSGSLRASIWQKVSVFNRPKKKPETPLFGRKRSRVLFRNSSLLYDIVLRGYIGVFTIAKRVLSCSQGLNYSSETLLFNSDGTPQVGLTVG